MLSLPTRPWTSSSYHWSQLGSTVRVPQAFSWTLLDLIIRFIKYFFLRVHFKASFSPTALPIWTDYDLLCHVLMETHSIKRDALIIEANCLEINGELLTKGKRECILTHTADIIFPFANCWTVVDSQDFSALNNILQTQRFIFLNIPFWFVFSILTTLTPIKTPWKQSSCSD